MGNKEAFKFTGEDAENYDRYLGPLIFEPYGRYLAAQIDSSNINSVLEIACGTGRVTRHIRKALPADVKLMASDISNDMLNVARREIGNEGIEYKVEDAQNLSFPDNSFDLVICQFGMMFLPDKNKGFAEIFRVLKPSGKFMFFTWDDTLNLPAFKLLINETILPYFENEDTKRFFVPFSLHNPHQLKSFLQTAGFKNIKADRVALKSGISTPQNIVTGLFRKHMLGKELMAKEPSAFEPIAQKLEKDMAQMFGVENSVFDLSAFLTSGKK